MLAQLLQDFVDFPIKCGSAVEREYSLISSYTLNAVLTMIYGAATIKAKGA